MRKPPSETWTICRSVESARPGAGGAMEGSTFCWAACPRRDPPLGGGLGGWAFLSHVGHGERGYQQQGFPTRSTKNALTATAPDPTAPPPPGL